MQKIGKKRGFVDVDWAISLGIFLLYLAWFFIFISPYFDTNRDLTPVHEIIKSSLDTELYWDIYRYPIVIESESIGTFEPIITDYTLNLTPSEFTIVPKYPYEIYNGKMLIIANITQEKETIYIVNSEKEYEYFQRSEDISSGRNYVSTKNNTFTIEYQNSSITKIINNNTEIARNLKFFVQNFEVEKQDINYYSGSIFSLHSFNTKYFANKIYAFAHNSKAKIEIDKIITDENINITYSLEIPKIFDKYYINNINFGELIVNYSECKTFDWNYIDFYNNETGISFIVDKNSRIDFCYDNTSTIYLNVTTALEDMIVNIIVHEDSYKKTVNISDSVITRTGIKEKISGISSEKMNNLNLSDYNMIKENWNYPSSREFNIMIEDTSHQKLMTYNNRKAPLSENVFVKDEYCLLLEEDGSFEECRIIIQTW